MAVIKRKGFGQVEPNHMSAQRTGQIYAQLIANKDIQLIENGQFMKYDYAKRETSFDGNVDGEWLLVYNEEKLYDPRKQNHRCWAMKKEDYVDGEMVPRLFKTNVGDIYTTNTLEANTSDTAMTEGVTVNLNDKLTPGDNGYLKIYQAAQDAGKPVFKVVAITTMADMQDAVKLQRIA